MLALIFAACISASIAARSFWHSASGLAFKQALKASRLRSYEVEHADNARRLSSKYRMWSSLPRARMLARDEAARHAGEFRPAAPASR